MTPEDIERSCSNFVANGESSTSRAAVRRLRAPIRFAGVVRTEGVAMDGSAVLETDFPRQAKPAAKPIAAPATISSDLRKTFMVPRQSMGTWRLARHSKA